MSPFLRPVAFIAVILPWWVNDSHENTEYKNHLETQIMVFSDSYMCYKQLSFVRSWELWQLSEKNYLYISLWLSMFIHSNQVFISQFGCYQEPLGKGGHLMIFRIKSVSGHRRHVHDEDHELGRISQILLWWKKKILKFFPDLPF